MKQCMKKSQNYFSEAEKKRNYSFVRQLWLRTKTSDIQSGRKRLLLIQLAKIVLAFLMVLEHRL